ncbi:MAG: hypothetical protein ABI876_06840, partial [Bacteroidota bacterium]
YAAIRNPATADHPGAAGDNSGATDYPATHHPGAIGCNSRTASNPGAADDHPGTTGSSHAARSADQTQGADQA